MSDQVEIHHTVDTCGTRCPIPLLRAKQALRTLKAGQRLKVLATDPSAKPDFDAMLKHLPHELIEYVPGPKTKDGVRIDIFIIEKKEAV